MNDVSLIDWMGVARNALWIAGLSIALAAWSYAIWQAKAGHTGLRRALGRAAFQAPCYFGLLLFAAGLVWSAARVWEQIAWAILAVASAWQMMAALRGGRRSRRA